MQTEKLSQAIATIFLMAAAFLLPPACVSAQASQTGLAYKKIYFNGIERSYYLHLPPSHKTAVQLPVVLVFHGGEKSDGDELAKYTGFDEIADREDFIAVYPNGVDAQWNDGRGKTFRKADNTDVDDVGFVSALIDHIIRDYNSDPSKVYATGLSNGGMMTLRLGCEISSKLAAIAPVIANIPKNVIEKCEPDSPLPVLLMNGTEDPLVPWGGGYVRFFRRTMGEVVSTEETIRFWVKQNRCNSAPEVKILPDKDPRDGSTVKIITYGNGENGSEVILYAIEGGGHSLPGSAIPQRRFTGKKNCDINGAEVIWTFFKRHSK